ncbi:uncharacterized protein LOC134180193 [Corticium candelabrum]|uniref:uncharacterized protein LOC134180193 n=1 Tax=Corticium candelabrum TaxID=121492 RepID=UPI002E25336B|nr:uncharacterized protein LOC134180193 [Corticium candelabrum]
MSGRCSICDVPFNSESQKTAHYEGARHKKKAAAVELGSSSTERESDTARESTSSTVPSTTALVHVYPRMCEVCPNVQLTSLGMAESHESGHKHKKKLDQVRTASVLNHSVRDSNAVTAYVDTTDGSSQKSSDESDIDPNENIDMCYICRCTFNHLDQAKKHYQGKEHVKKAKAREQVDELKEKGETVYFCDTCSALCNSFDMLEIHNRSESHRKMKETTVEKLMAASPVKVLKAPKREHERLKNTSLQPRPYTELIYRVPRKYQQELYTKILRDNTICFLPTGMGKTLTSTLVVSHMMQANPTRQVVFVVDRKILVFQQADAMLSDLKSVLLPYGDGTSSHAPRIASVCGDKRVLAEGCRKLYEHDLIVITAGSYLNLLKTEELRWDDVSCLILDEAHHCTKKHPYKVLVKKYYDDEAGEFNHHPKLVGLTASPAGDDTVLKTEKKLTTLMKNMSSKLAKVTENEEEFRKHQPTAKIRCVKAFYSEEEKQLAMIVSRYAAACFDKASEGEELAGLAEIKIEDIRSNGLDSESVKRLSQSAKIYLENWQVSDKTRFYLNHLETICGAWSILHEAGIEACQEHIASLKEDLQTAESQTYSLPAQELRECDKIPAGKAVGTGVDALLKELLALPWEKRHQKSQKMFALVLVQRREAASKLQDYLNEHEELKTKGLSIARIVGHGKSGQDGAGPGMTTAQQKSTMTDVREGNHQIVVATSVAEEGLDLPECRLVVQMDVPRTVTSLVQIRGRARERGGEFVAICRDENQEAKVECLLRQEENMNIATTNIVKKQMLEQMAVVAK